MKSLYAEEKKLSLPTRGLCDGTESAFLQKYRNRYGKALVPGEKTGKIPLRIRKEAMT